MDEEVIKRYLDVLVERQQESFQVLAEGHQMLAEKIDGLTGRMDRMEDRADRFEVEVLARFDAVDRRLDAVDRRFDAVDQRFDAVDSRQDRFEAEVRHEFGEVKAMIKFSFAELDGRLTILEHQVSDLLGRVERLEAKSPAA